MSAQRKTDILCGDRQHGTAEKAFPRARWLWQPVNLGIGEGAYP